MKKLLVAPLLLLMLNGCSHIPLIKHRAHPFVIENLDSGFAFKGKIEGTYYRKDSKLHIDVKKWTIHFECRNQEGRRLDKIYFELSKEQDDGRFDTDRFSQEIEVSSYIRRDHPLELNDLLFSVPIEENECLTDYWLTATYENTRTEAGGRCQTTGYCYASSDELLFSDNKSSYYKLKNKKND